MTDDDALREIGWVAREARALSKEQVPQDSERWREYLRRKRAVLAHIASRHTSSRADWVET